MVKKKRSVSKKSNVKRKSSGKTKLTLKSDGLIYSKNKVSKVLRYLVLFVLLFLLSYIISVIALPDSFWAVFFDILWLIFCFFL
jgi:hypothetical protein